MRQPVLRKGEFPVSMLIGMIVMVVAFLIIVKSNFLIGESIKEFSERSICKQSVQVHSELKSASSPLVSKINCPTVFLDVKKDQIDYSLRKDTRKVKLQGDKEMQIKKAMADEIYYCWNQFLEGKKDLFGSPSTYCSVCSFITFEDKNAEIKGFNEFILKTPVPNKALAKEGVTYFDYMQGYQKKGGIENQAMQFNDFNDATIDTSENYAVVFVYAKSEPLIDNALEIADKFWQSSGGKVAIIGGVVLIAGGAIISFTGIGAVVGIPIIAIGASVIRTVAVSGAIDGAIETSQKRQVIRDWTAFTMFGPYDSEIFKKLGCQEITSDKNK